MATRDCDACGAPYEAKRATSRYCSTRCRTRASRSGQAARGKPAARELPAQSSGVVAAVSARLESAGVLDTMEAQAALLLAERMQAGTDAGSSVAALNRELMATVDRALALRSVAADPMDELRARRERRNAS